MKIINYHEVYDGLVWAIQDQECNHPFLAQDISHITFQFFLIQVNNRT